MRVGRAAYTIERFRASPASASPGRELAVSGWFHADVEVCSMCLDIEIGSKVIIEYPITHFSLPSADLIIFFGETAANKRFKLTVAVDDEVASFSSAVLRVTLMNGDSHAIELDSSFEAHDKLRLSTEDIVMRFESLGDNCEFGLMQRAVGRERLGLFRYAGTFSTPALVCGLNERFAGFATRDDLEFHLFHDEWIGASRKYGYVFHTRRFKTVITEDQIREEEASRLSFLARLFLEDVEGGEKIFVRRLARFEEGSPEDGMLELYSALRAVGPAKLLWVTLADTTHEGAEVQQLDDGLYRGYIAKLSPYENAYDFAADSWLELLAKTIELDDARQDAMLALPALDPSLE